MAEKKSKDVKKVGDAQIKIMEFNFPEDILEFIKGDERKSVRDTADTRLKELKHEGLKPGQVKKITDDSKDFKGPGVEGKKSYVTGEDVLKTLREKGHKI